MKMYLNTQQTAKLIELGFENPKSLNGEYNGWQFMPTPAYSIGELIEMLPKKIEMSDDETGKLKVSFGDLCAVYYTSFGDIYYDTSAIELIDALYDMVVQLKEEGVI